MKYCIYTFEAFSLSADSQNSVDFICFSNIGCYSGWQQKQTPSDILCFSSIRQQKILKILPWKYLSSDYNFAIWIDDLNSIDNGKVNLLVNSLDNDYDIFLFKDKKEKSYFGNLNVESQFEKYAKNDFFDTQYFYDTSLIAFNIKSESFKKFSLSWINEVLRESLHDEISFSYLLNKNKDLKIKFIQEEQNNRNKSIDKQADAFFKIVIPNYNNGDALTTCIESIVNQSFQDFRIIIVDDCSTDQSKDIAEEYSRKYPDKIYFLSSEERSYSGKCRNIGKDYNPFTSKYAWFIDGDDRLYSKDVLKKLYEKASITNADIVSFDCIYAKDNKSVLKHFDIPNFSAVDTVFDKFGIAPWHRIIKTDKVVSFFENCIRRQDLATVFRQYANCEHIEHLDEICYVYNSRDYSKLIEPVWSLQNVYCELIEQTKYLSIDYVNAIHAYIAKYPKIFGELDYDKIHDQKIVALASYPPRKEGMLKVFSELFPQCDHFCLYLNEYNEIPEEFLTLSKEEKRKLTIEIGNKNLKDYGKFYWFKKFHGYYFTVDDDLDYPENYCNIMVEKLKSKPFSNNIVVGMHGNDFSVVNNSFIAKKQCHSFIAEEKIDVPVDCLGTGTTCFYPDNLSFSRKTILDSYNLDNDLDMSFSILCKEDGKMLYRISSKKNFLEMNGFNFINPLANIHFAWEKRYLQYDFWLHKDSKNGSCAFCCIPSNKIKFETFDLFGDIEKEYKKKNIDFYVIPIEEKALLNNSNELFFIKFEFVKKFFKKYQSVIIHPLKEKDLEYTFYKEDADKILSKIEKIKEKHLVKISDKILKANISKN